jgi:hypothetical protein
MLTPWRCFNSRYSRISESFRVRHVSPKAWVTVPGRSDLQWLTRPWCCVTKESVLLCQYPGYDKRERAPHDWFLNRVISTSACRWNTLLCSNCTAFLKCRTRQVYAFSTHCQYLYLLNDPSRITTSRLFKWNPFGELYGIKHDHSTTRCVTERGRYSKQEQFDTVKWQRFRLQNPSKQDQCAVTQSGVSDTAPPSSPKMISSL